MIMKTNQMKPGSPWRPPHWILLIVTVLAAILTTVCLVGPDPMWTLAAFIALCTVAAVAVGLLCRAAWTKYVDDWPGITDVTALVPSACVIAVAVAGRHLF